MTIKANNVCDAIEYGCWLERCREGFIQRLERRGYALGTIRVYGRLVGALCTAATDRRIDIRSLGDTTTARLTELIPSTLSSPRSQQLWKTVANRFVRYLAETGAIDESALTQARQYGKSAHLRAEYRDWLCHQRGLSSRTVGNNLKVFDAFMRFRYGDDRICLDSITQEDLVNFLVPQGVEPRAFPDRTKASRLRSLLRFLYWDGKIRLNLAETISRTAHRHSNRPAAHLRPQEIQHIIDGVRGDTALARRNRAMLLLTARLGLRAREVVAIRLEDIRWSVGDILIRGKGHLHDPMPLPVDVGEALVDYIRHGRQGSSRHLFVTVRAPWRPFEKGVIVSTVVKDAVAKAGDSMPSKQLCSAYLFRHSLATALLRQGTPFHEIGNVLRHRQTATTMIYARYDIDALRSIAQPWPTAKGGPA